MARPIKEKLKHRRNRVSVRISNRARDFVEKEAERRKCSMGDLIEEVLLAEERREWKKRNPNALPLSEV